MQLDDEIRGYFSDRNVLERRASGFVGSAAGHEQGAGGASSKISSEQYDNFRSIRRRATGWAIASGALSGAIIGGAETYVRLVVLGDPDEFEWREHLPTWIAFYTFVGIVTAVEIAFLYWNALRAAAAIGALTGSMEREGLDRLLATGLSRSALEIPNPRSHIYDVDPYALVPRWRLVIQNILYKAKVGATSFVLRVLMRRVFARAAIRGFIPLIAIPLYALWNALITWRAIGETWVRARGPLMVDEIIRLAEQLDGGSEQRELLRAGVDELIRRGSDAHPNYVLLLSRLRAGSERRQARGGAWPPDKERLRKLADDDRALLARIWIIASLIAGGPRRAQIRFLREAHELLRLRFTGEDLAVTRRYLLEKDPRQEPAPVR